MPCLSHLRAKSGCISWIPYLVMWLFMILTGTAEDYLITRTNVRKLMIFLNEKVSRRCHKKRRHSSDTGVTENSEEEQRIEPMTERKISSVAEENNKDKIRKHRRFLEEFMEPDFGLLDKIREKRIISSKDIEDVEAKTTSCDKNSTLLQHILTNDQSDGLIAALRDSNQIHIVNYLEASGEYSNEYGGDWPLTKKELKILDTNHGSLVDNLTLTSLLDHLFSSKVVNHRQRESIAAMPTRHEKSQKLLKILRRRSLRDYHQTIGCLRLSHQGHIAKMLGEGGVVLKVHVNLGGENVTEAENEIVTKLENLLIDSSIEHLSRILEHVHLSIIAAKTGLSIVLYIYCRTSEELEQLHDSLFSKELKHSIDMWFNNLLNRPHKIAVTAITVSEEELRKMRAYFKGTEHQPTTLCDLPLEILDMILQKSYLHWILNSPTKQRDEEIIRSLMSVDVCFNKRITRKRIKTTIWRYLRGFYKKNKKRTAIIRNNQKYLLENIEPNDTLMASLLSLNCITEEQRHLIRQFLKQKHRRKRDKNTGLLHFLRSINEANDVDRKWLQSLR